LVLKLDIFNALRIKRDLSFFYVFLTVRLKTILANDQLIAQILVL